MNTERLMRMVMRLLMRHGVKYLSKGGKADPKAADAAKRLRMGRRFGRF